MRSAITASLVPEAKGGPFVFHNGLEDACRQAAASGFDAIEIFPPEAGAVEVESLRQLLDRHRLKVAAFGTGAGWVVRRLTLTHADPAVRQAARAFITDIINLAGSFGVPAIIGSMQGRWEGGVDRAQALGWLAEALEELAERAAAQRTVLLYEPLNRYETNLLNRLGETASWLSQLRARNVRVLADLFHMNLEEANSAAAIREAGAMIGHVHFADSNRRAVGYGQSAIEPVIAALRDIGYDGYLSAEILPLPDAESAARQTMAALRRHLGTR